MCPQAHLVAAFEQSLGNMTIRLQSLTTTAEQKVCVRTTVCFIIFVGIRISEEVLMTFYNLKHVPMRKTASFGL